MILPEHEAEYGQYSQREAELSDKKKEAVYGPLDSTGFKGNHTLDCLSM